jgi:hypothetical protein
MRVDLRSAHRASRCVALCVAALPACAKALDASPTAGSGSIAPASAAPSSSAEPPRGAAPQIVPGTYKLDSPSFGGTLTVQSASPLRFRLVVVGKRESAPHGELEGAQAKMVGDATALFEPDRDCSLELRFEPARVEVKQKGTCDSQGFGAFVDASGTYVREGK